MTTEQITFHLTLLQRIFLTFDQPETCLIAEIYSMIMMIVIVFSCTNYVLSSDPGFRHKPSHCEFPVCHNDPDLCPGTEMCEPVSPPIFEVLETICIAIFTFDYGIRILLVGQLPARLARVIPSEWDDTETADPAYSWYYQTYRYLSQTMNIIDLVAILPFYIGFATNSGGSVSIVRILRLARVLRVFKIGGFSSGMALIGRAVSSSLPAIGILFFFATLGVILFGSIIFFVESGVYVVSRDFPEGEYVRWNYNHTEKEKSPFVSILVSCYWAVVTSTTVGYGELHPTSGMGRFLAMVLMYVGILVLALPISVIGAAFTREYEKHHLMEVSNTMTTTTTPLPESLPSTRKEQYFRLQTDGSDNASCDDKHELEAQDDSSSWLLAEQNAPGQVTQVTKRSVGEIRRELALVNRQLRGLANTVDALMAELEYCEEGSAGEMVDSTPTIISNSTQSEKDKHRDETKGEHFEMESQIRSHELSM